MAWLPRIALALAPYGLLRLFAVAWREPAPADLPLLALTGALVLLPSAVLIEPSFVLALAGAAQVALALLPAEGPTRAAAAVLALVATLAVDLADRWRRPGGLFTPTGALAGALAIQALCRAERLLDPSLGPATLVDLVLLPTLGAAGAVGLARRHGDLPAAIASGALASLGPGFGWEASLALLALGRPGLETARASTRALAATALLASAAVLVHPLWACILLAAAWAAARPGAAPALLAAALAAAGTGMAAPRPWTEVAADGSLLLLLLPMLPLAAARRVPLTVGALLAVACLRPPLSLGALAAPVVLLALQIPQSAAAAQAVWSGLLLAAAVAAGAYPWLRAAPLEALLGVLPGGSAALLPLSLLAVGLLWTASRRRAAVSRAALVSAALAALVLAPRPQSLAAGGFTLTAAQPSWTTRLPAEGSTRLVLDTYLSHGLELAPGTPVAILDVHRPDGTLRRRLLAAGRDTADWALRRPPGPAPPAPPAWSSYVAPRGGFFGQVYRTRWSPGDRLEGELVLTRHPALPPQVAVSVVALAGRR